MRGQISSLRGWNGTKILAMCLCGRCEGVCVCVQLCTVCLHMRARLHVYTCTGKCARERCVRQWQGACIAFTCHWAHDARCSEQRICWGNGVPTKKY